MQIVSVPYALPGQCFICGSATRKYFIDTERQIEFHGAVYFCSECLTEMAHKAGFLSPEAADKMKFQMETLEKTVYELIKKEQGLETAIGGLVAAGLSIPNVSDDNRGINVPDEQAELEPSGATNSLGAGTREASESSNDENLGELRPNDRTDESEFSLDL